MVYIFFKKCFFFISLLSGQHEKLFVGFLSAGIFAISNVFVIIQNTPWNVKNKTKQSTDDSAIDRSKIFGRCLFHLLSLSLFCSQLMRFQIVLRSHIFVCAHMFVSFQRFFIHFVSLQMPGVFLNVCLFICLFLYF